MGIDVYAEWRDQSNEDIGTQVNAWLSTDRGDVGYLREAYHGAPYVTEYFCPEAFEPDGAAIAAATLRERLPGTLHLVELRERKLYDASDAEIEAVKESYRKFVELCEAKERETGESVRVRASF